MEHALLVARLQQLITALDLRRPRPAGRLEAKTAHDSALLRAEAVSQLEALATAAPGEFEARWTAWQTRGRARRLEAKRRWATTALAALFIALSAVVLRWAFFAP